MHIVSLGGMDAMLGKADSEISAPYSQTVSRLCAAGKPMSFDGMRRIQGISDVHENILICTIDLEQSISRDAPIGKHEAKDIGHIGGPGIEESLVDAIANKDSSSIWRRLGADALASHAKLLSLGLNGGYATLQFFGKRIKVSSRISFLEQGFFGIRPGGASRPIGSMCHSTGVRAIWSIGIAGIDVLDLAAMFTDALDFWHTVIIPQRCN